MRLCENLKARVLKSIITWPEMGQKTGQAEKVFLLIMKITISFIVIGLKNSYFPLIHWPSCCRTVCYPTVCCWTVCYRRVQLVDHIQSCCLNQPITLKVVITHKCKLNTNASVRTHARTLAFVFRA